MFVLMSLKFLKDPFSTNSYQNCVLDIILQLSVVSFCITD